MIKDPLNLNKNYFFQTEDENHKVSSIHFDKESHQIQENGNETHGNSNDPVKMLLNHPKRSSLKKSCLLPSRRVESFGKVTSY